MRIHRDVFRNITLIFQFGINMLVPILLCTFLGIFLDRLFHTSFIVIILFFLGAVAGFRNIYIFARGSQKNTSFLGTDAETQIKELADGKGKASKEDFFEKMDRVYKENMNE